MFKKILINLLTLLLLPIGVAASVLIVAILALGATIAFPALVLGLSLKSAGFISEKFTNWLFPKEAVDQSKTFPRFTIVSITLAFTLTILGMAPAAAAILVTAAIVTPLLLLILAIFIPFGLALKAVNAIFSGSENNNSAAAHQTLANNDLDIQEEQINKDDFKSSSLQVLLSSAEYFSTPSYSPATEKTEHLTTPSYSSAREKEEEMNEANESIPRAI
jgi:hypothetical protein